MKIFLRSNVELTTGSNTIIFFKKHERLVDTRFKNRLQTKIVQNPKM